MSKLVITVLLVSSFIGSTFGQIFDPYGFYSTPNISNTFLYLKGIPCYYNENCTTVGINSSLNYIQLNPRMYHQFDTNNLIFKFNVTSCLPIKMLTKHDTIVTYSYDGINWSNEMIGMGYVSPNIGWIYFNLTSIISENIHLYLYQSSTCINYYKNTTIFSTYIIGDTVLRYNISTPKLSMFMYSNNCKYTSRLNYTSSFYNNKYTYDIDSSFGAHTSLGGSKDNYTITLDVKPHNKTMNCSLNIYFNILLDSSNYSSRSLFNNGSQVNTVLAVNESYDINWSGGVILDGGAAVAPSFEIQPVKFQSMSHQEVYNNIDKLSQYVSPGYFDPLLRYFGKYINSNLSLVSNFNFTTNLTISNSTLSINVMQVPVSLNINNSLLILPPNDIQVQGINFTGNNTLRVGTGVLTIISANLGGTLSIQGEIKNGTVIMGYTNYSGTFESVNININSSECDKCKDCDSDSGCECDYTLKYDTNRLVVLLNEDVSECGGTDMILMLIIVSICMGIIIILLITIIIIFNVEWCKKRIFPHRDRARVHIPTNTTVKENDYKSRVKRYKAYDIPK